MFLLLNFLPFKIFAITNNQELLNLFHKYKMTKCDKFILKNTNLINKPNWSLDIERPNSPIGKGYSIVTLILTYGSKGDTVKKDFTFVETPKRCILTERATITFNGSCSQNINGDFWYISSRMPRLDYTAYKNKGSAPMLAKEIDVGNFKLCIQEMRLNSESRLG